jgi:hypothetical protein
VTTSLAPTDESIESLKRIAEKLLGLSDVSIDSIDGGRNSRVYHLATREGSYAFKTYFRHASDSRARMDTEFESLRFLWDSGERSIPRPVAASAEQDCAVYEWIEGGRIMPGEITAADIEVATGFLTRVASYRTLPGSSGLRPASEACFSCSVLVDCLRARLAPLLARRDHAELVAFVDQELVPAMDAVSAWSRERLGDGFDRNLAMEARTLSPSDFGFHNALRRNGTLVFLDLEYFGWDDPVKMVCDFVLHPGMQIPADLKGLYARTMLRAFPEAAERIAAFYPLYGLKWCLILLNEFLPAHLLRRKFAGMNERDRETRQSEQLAKARSMLRVVLADDYRFPYGD